MSRARSPPRQRQQITVAAAQQPRHECPSDVQRIDLFRAFRNVMRFTAILPLPLHRYFDAPLAALLDAVYEWFMYLVLLHIVVLYACTICLRWDTGDMELLVSCFTQTVIYFWAISLKFFFRRVQPQRGRALMDYVNLQHRTCSAIGFTYVTMDECSCFLNRSMSMFIRCCFSGVIVWLFVPLVNNDRSLPLPCWYPIDYKAPVNYQVIYLLQIIGQLQVASIFSMSSSYYTIMCILLSGQYDVLNCSLKNIIATAYINMGAPQDQLLELREKQAIADAELNQYYCATEKSVNLDCLPHLLDATKVRPASFQSAFKLALQDCVEHYRYILHALKELEALYYIIWYFKTFEVTFLVCLVSFDWVKVCIDAPPTMRFLTFVCYFYSTENASFMRSLSTAQYLLLALLEMLIICYSGEIVYRNSQRCDEALLRSPWYLHMVDVKLDLLFFLKNSGHAFQLTAGKLYALNLEKFRGIITSAFSFLTLLQKMDQRQG